VVGGKLRPADLDAECVPHDRAAFSNLIKTHKTIAKITAA
jgi:hypothetical protein